MQNYEIFFQWLKLFLIKILYQIVAKILLKLMYFDILVQILLYQKHKASIQLNYEYFLIYFSMLKQTLAHLIKHKILNLRS